MRVATGVVHRFRGRLSPAVGATRPGLLCLALSSLLPPACGIPGRGPAVPPALTARAEIPGIEHVRYYPRDDNDQFVEDFIGSTSRLQQHLASEGDGERPPQVQYLALSGGGDNGAFGAGVLVGWSEHGTRPEFELVTGTSTGALIAPFAYLGSEYDDMLRQVYTTTEADQIFSPRGMLAAVLDDGMADTTPLYRVIEQYITDDLLERIAAEWLEKGRALLIATTNLDAHRSVHWNMGKIAASGDPKALELFRKILLASASIPGLFPPVMLNVEVDGQKYQEMHVDGGARVQTFFVHSSFLASMRERDVAMPGHKALYIIRNARLDPEWAMVERRTLTIAGKAIQSLIQSQGTDDLFRIYLHADTDGLDFNLAFISPDFDHPHEEEFDRDYMRALFDHGYQSARQGYPWQKTPPNFTRPGTPRRATQTDDQPETGPARTAPPE